MLVSKRRSALRADSLFLLAIAATGASATHGATRAKPVRAAAVQSVLDCRAITDDAKRLACFDAAVAAMTVAESSGDLVTVDREQRKAVRRQTFGFTLPALSIFDKGDAAGEENRIEVKIASARQDGYGKWVVTLDDGAIWRQVDDNEIEPPPHAGSTAVISHGALGSFFMKIDGRGFMRARRDR